MSETIELKRPCSLLVGQTVHPFDTATGSEEIVTFAPYIVESVHERNEPCPSCGGHWAVRLVGIKGEDDESQGYHCEQSFNEYYD